MRGRERERERGGGEGGGQRGRGFVRQSNGEENLRRSRRDFIFSLHVGSTTPSRMAMKMASSV